MPNVGAFTVGLGFWGKGPHTEPNVLQPERKMSESACELSAELRQLWVPSASKGSVNGFRIVFRAWGCGIYGFGVWGI